MKRIMTSMLRPHASVVVLLFLSAGVFAQTRFNSKPANWQNYRVEAQRSVFSMPKMPLAVDQSNPCRGEKTIVYGSYHDGVAYLARVTSAVKTPDFCTEKANFGPSNFADRARELQSWLQTGETPAAGKDSDELRLSGRNQIHRLVNDYANRRWFELAAIGGVENKPEIERFLASLNLDEKAAGTDIGAGAETPVPDEMAIEAESKSSVSESAADRPLLIALKPRARYTDQARKKMTQGTVVLRVTFLPSGSIGAVDVIRALPDGLTEEAVAATRKLLFVPVERQGMRVAVTKAVEYSFSIY